MKENKTELVYNTLYALRKLLGVNADAIIEDIKSNNGYITDHTFNEIEHLIRNKEYRDVKEHFKTIHTCYLKSNKYNLELLRYAELVKKVLSCIELEEIVEEESNAERIS